MSVYPDLQPGEHLRWPSVGGAIGLFLLSHVVVLVLFGSALAGEPSVTLMVGVGVIYPAVLGSLALGSILLLNRRHGELVWSFLTCITRPELRMTFLLTLLLLPVIFGLSWLSSVLGVESQRSTVDVEVFLHPLSMVTAFTLVPAGEELLFRGVLFGAFSRWGGRVAFMATLLISVVLHWPLSHIIGVLPGMALFTWLRMKTGRLAPSMLAHAVLNALVVGIAAIAAVLAGR